MGTRNGLQEMAINSILGRYIWSAEKFCSS